MECDDEGPRVGLSGRERVGEGRVGEGQGERKGRGRGRSTPFRSRSKGVGGRVPGGNGGRLQSHRSKGNLVQVPASDGSPLTPTDTDTYRRRWGLGGLCTYISRLLVTPGNDCQFPNVDHPFKQNKKKRSKININNTLCVLYFNR